MKTPLVKYLKTKRSGELYRGYDVKTDWGYKYSQMSITSWFINGLSMGLKDAFSSFTIHQLRGLAHFPSTRETANWKLDFNARVATVCQLHGATTVNIMFMNTTDLIDNLTTTLAPITTAVSIHRDPVPINPFEALLAYAMVLSVLFIIIIFTGGICSTC